MFFKGNKNSIDNTRDYLDKIPFAISVQQLIFDANGDPSDLILIDINKTFEKDTGKSREQLVGQKLTDLYPEIKQKLIELFAEYGDHFEKDSQFEFEIYFDFNKHWYEVSVSILNKNEILIVYIDCTNKKLAEKELTISEKRFKSHFENSTIGIYRTTPDGKILMANPALVKLLEYKSFEELAQKNLEEESYKKTGYERIDFKNDIEENGSIIGRESVWVTKSNKKIYVRESARVVRNSADGILFYEGTVEDISEKKIAEMQISRLNHLFYDLQIDPLENLDIIVKRANEILDGSFSFYVQFDKEQNLYDIISTSNTPIKIEKQGSLEFFICSEIFDEGNGKAVAINDINKTDYALSDSIFNKLGITSLIGAPISFENNIIGSLCVVDVKERNYTETETEIMGTLVKALSIEQARYTVEHNLKNATKVAEEANRAKDQFLANMSHEIRTPLNGVIGFSELLHSSEKDPSKARLLKMVEDSGNQLLALINDLFDYSRIEAQKLKLVENDFDLVAIISESIAYFESKIKDKQLKVTFESNGIKEKWVKGDGYKMRLILSNLIGNAVKFTNKGKIDINLNVSNLKKDLINAEISVEDTGVGIEEAQMESIFDEFKQIEYYLTKRNRGAGLGLSIVKKILDYMGGAIEVNSKPGKGSKFIVTLPFKPGGKNKSVEIINMPKEETIPESNSIKILLAEDNEANQFLIKAITRSRNWDITVVGDGSEAVEEFEKDKFDLILMDVQMPVMNGYEATQIIRNKENERGNGERIPIIALTAYAMKADKDKCIEAGMDDYISKPFKRQEFLDRIIQAIEENRQ